MAVFTHVKQQDIQSLLEKFSIGDFKSLEGIQGGIENTNYFLTTSKNSYVLTIFERLDFEQLPFYLEVMSHLAKNNILVPLPIADNKNRILFELYGKPAAIVSKLEGKSDLKPNTEQIKSIAYEMAKMHLTSNNFAMYQPNLRSLDWWQTTIPNILDCVTLEEKKLLTSELAILSQFFNSITYKNLPQGICHCDLFRDNALFVGNKLGGIFDFYFAGIDKFLFDICVAVNDWCINYETKLINKDLFNEFINAYNTIRPLTSSEQEAMPLMLRASAFRFWVSRLWDWYLPRESKLLTPHNPQHFEKILNHRINNK